MSNIAYKKGDATCPQAKGVKIICHVCNDIGGWGKGFVLALSKRWELPETSYRAWYAAGKSGVPSRDRIAAAGGELLGAAFKLLGEMVNSSASAAPPDALVASLRSGLEAFVEGGDKPRLTITLPDRATLDQLSLSLARLLSAVAQPAAVKTATGTG